MYNNATQAIYNINETEKLTTYSPSNETSEIITTGVEFE